MRIEDIASKHLGKAGDGSVVAPYVTPNDVDASLLVGVPRHLNRTDYNIDDDNLPFKGYDVWHCYEFSTMNCNGYPISGVMKIVYPCDSHCIVESKSLKLYMNSFNMRRSAFAELSDVVDECVQIVKEHLSTVVQTADIQCHLHTTSSTVSPFLSDYKPYTFNSALVYDNYNECASLIHTQPRSSIQRLHFDNLRSNCRVTNQPDWGDVFIFNIGVSLDEDSLSQYIVSMRQENHFHEEIVECIYKRLYDKLGDNIFGVSALYTRRGGIDINPVRFKTLESLTSEVRDLINASVLTHKTLKQ